MPVDNAIHSTCLQSTNLSELDGYAQGGDADDRGRRGRKRTHDECDAQDLSCKPFTIDVSHTSRATDSRLMDDDTRHNLPLLWGLSH